MLGNLHGGCYGIFSGLETSENLLYRFFHPAIAAHSLLPQVAGDYSITAFCAVYRLFIGFAGTCVGLERFNPVALYEASWWCILGFPIQDIMVWKGLNRLFYRLSSYYATHH